MRIITTTCQHCGTILAGNLLVDERTMTCPGPACDAVVAFDDLPEDDRSYLLDNPEQVDR